MRRAHQRMEQRRSQSGFTLVELLVVTGIISILGGVSVLAVGSAYDNAAKNACVSERLTFETAENAASVNPDESIDHYLKSPSGKYFKVAGTTFDPIAGTGFDAHCNKV